MTDVSVHNTKSYIWKGSERHGSGLQQQNHHKKARNSHLKQEERIIGRVNGGGGL